MAVALQIREVPDDVRDVLADQARRRGQSVQAYLLDVVSREARLGARVDLFWPRAEFRVEIPVALDPVMVVREGRDERA